VPLIREIGYVLVGAGVLSVIIGLALIAFINSENAISGVIIGCLLMVIGAGLCNYAQEE